MSSSNKKRSVSSGLASSTNTGASAQAKTPSRSTVVEFNPDYTYVKKDLARIGILAGSFFVILVVLSFFLR